MTQSVRGEAGGWRAAWTPRRLRLWLGMASLAAWLPVIGVPFRDFLDFSAFYVAAQHTFTPDVVRLEPIVLDQAAAGLPISPYLYTPLFALLFVPLSWLPYETMPHAWVYNATLLLPALAAWRSTPRAGAGRGRTAGCSPRSTPPGCCGHWAAWSVSRCCRSW